jgi:hypothetical protein
MAVITVNASSTSDSAATLKSVMNWLDPQTFSISAGNNAVGQDAPFSNPTIYGFGDLVSPYVTAPFGSGGGGGGGSGSVRPTNGLMYPRRT